MSGTFFKNLPEDLLKNHPLVIPIPREFLKKFLKKCIELLKILLRKLKKSVRNLLVGFKWNPEKCLTNSHGKNTEGIPEDIYWKHIPEKKTTGNYWKHCQINFSKKSNRNSLWNYLRKKKMNEYAIKMPK